MLHLAAAVRLAKFEHTRLHEMYTSVLLRNTTVQCDSVQLGEELATCRQQWVRVCLGGTSWTRCWCVVSSSGYEQSFPDQRSSRIIQCTGLTYPSIKFYESNRTQDLWPKQISEMKNPYSAFSMTPPRLDLNKAADDPPPFVKLEGTVTRPSHRAAEGHILCVPSHTEIFQRTRRCSGGCSLFEPRLIFIGQQIQLSWRVKTHRVLLITLSTLRILVCTSSKWPMLHV